MTASRREKREIRADYSLQPTGQITGQERAQLDDMKRAVYPPEQYADWPGREREWVGPEWTILVSRDGEIVSCTGIVLTEGEMEGRTLVIGGVGGIATHPEHRGRGYAAASIEMAMEWIGDHSAEFALLVCRGELVPYYEKLGWRVFDGTLRVTQFGEPETFTFNVVMVRPVCGAAPSVGVIDLLGPPW